MLPLYQRIFGRAFAQLAPPLQRFHSQRSGGRAAGVLRITRGSNCCSTRLADWLGLPPAGDAVPTRLEVHVEGERERWTRHFGNLRLESMQWEQGGQLLEGFGRICFGFQPVVAKGVLGFELAGVWLGRLRVPRPFHPSLRAEVTGRSQGWHLRVCVTAPLLGLLVQYEGELVAS
jgi:hypothetical protein